MSCEKSVNGEFNGSTVLYFFLENMIKHTNICMEHHVCILVNSSLPSSLPLNVVILMQNPQLEFLRKVLIGFTAGTLGSCINIPFDVAKSRIQGPQPVPGQIKYRTCFATIGTVYREEG